MKLLLDTHTLLWAAWMPEKLSAETRELINDTAHELFFSAASIWEVAIKSTLDRDDFKFDARILRRGLLDNGYNELPITSEHAVSIDTLPKHHKDPFDRILIAQSITEGFTFITKDKTLTQYPGAITLVD